MTTDATSQLLSYDDYAAIDDDERYEVLEGVLVPMGPAPRIRHQGVAGNIHTALNLYARSSRAGRAFISPVDVVMRAQRAATILQPDVVFVLKEHYERITEPNIQGPPDIVVEVLSPSNARKDAIRKRRLYEKFGVPEYWVVPEWCDRIEVLKLVDGVYARPVLYEVGDVLTTPLLPGFELPVGEVFDADEAEDEADD